ncbi:MAG: aromatic ring-hydroxylating dioxygenase subunit alpha [Acidimicrobiaceae bacterium]|nr:aromatic ring-hydroxylating dioxygenase subunit alpha [Acidimicrobiaceae bacterium]
MADLDRIETLVRTGPDTVMGNYLRRYWVPALLESELPEAGSPPVRVKIMSEELIGFRDENNRIALIQEWCPHRGASLFFGRNEGEGLRCSFHGWMYDVSGQCIDMPSEPEQSRFRERISVISYPCEVRGGIIWAYMGPQGQRPPLPELEWSLLPETHRYCSMRIQESNYLQALEGGIDSSHVSFLHRDDLEKEPLFMAAKGNQYLRADTHPKFEVVESSGGLLIGARREAEEGYYYWRITQFILPWFTLIPPFGDHAMGGHAWVPIDDEHCLVWSINFHPSRPLTDHEIEGIKSGSGIHAALVPGTHKTVANKQNDYLVDRKAQREKLSYSGIFGVGMQDSAMQESIGPIQNRSREHLGTSDVGIVMARRRLAKAAIALRDENQKPPALDASSQKVRAASLLLPKGQSFAQGAEEVLVAGPDVMVATL